MEKNKIGPDGWLAIGFFLLVVFMAAAVLGAAFR
jgi:hypothetical protein